MKIAGSVAYFLIGTALALGVGGIRRRPQSERLRERLAIFRNLQVGIVRVDADVYIIEANDRAEELLRCTLPKHLPAPGVREALLSRLGIRHELHYPPGVGIRRRFYDLIDVCLCETPDDRGGAAYIEIFERDILALRHSGRSSTYYARLRVADGDATALPRRWLRIAASPVMHHRQDRVRGAQLSHIFATVSEVHETVAQQLEAAVQQQRRSS